MARRRFFVNTVAGGKAALEGETAEHLRKVLRAEPGRVFEISDNRDVYLAEIDSFGRNSVQFRVLERIQADQPPVRLTLLASLIKFDRFEWIVEKATELGAEKIVPVLAGRSEKGLERAAAKRSDRWRKVALESSQQSRRSRLPEIEDCVTLEEALGAIGQFRFLLDEEREAPPLMAALESAGPAVSSDVVCLLVGPEGGWTSQEREAAVGAGWAQVSLGPTILRTETAAVAALAIVANFWQATEKRKPPAAGAIGGPQTRSQ